MTKGKFVLLSTICLTFCIIYCNCVDDNDLLPVLPCESNVTLDEEPPPTFPRTFRAKYEIVSSPNSSSRIFVTVNYDADNNRVSFIKNLQGLQQTIVLDYNKGHSVIFSELEDGSSPTCSVSPVENAEEYRYEIENIFPFLELKAESDKIFSAEGLFGANFDKLRGYLGTDIIRDGIPCRKWLYCYEGSNNLGPLNSVFVYWSDIQWITPGAERPIVLGYEIKVFDASTKTPITTTFVNVIYISDDIDLASFHIPEGIWCSSENSSRPLPIQEPKGQVVYFQTEILFQDRRKILESETKIDLINEFGKISYQANGKTVTNIADMAKKIVYIQRDNECSVQALKTGLFGALTQDEIPIIHLANLHELYNEENRLEWMYIGQNRRRNLLTDVWQRMRSDWPYPGLYSVKSLWDWHFINKTTSDGDIVAHPVHLQIKILIGNIPYLMRGTVLQYSFHDYKTADVIGLSGLNDFDIGQCFSEIDGQKQHLRFQVEVTNNTYLNTPGFFDNYLFLWSWKVVIASVAEVSLLRVTQVKPVIMENKLHIQFYLLGDVSNETSSGGMTIGIAKAKKNLIEFLNSGSLSIAEDGDNVYAAVPNTLTDAVVTQCVTKSVPMKRLKRSTYQYVQTNKKEKKLFPPDSVVGVCVGTFLSGVAIGSGLLLYVAVKKNLFYFTQK